MTEESGWSQFKKIVKNYFGWWVEPSKIKKDDSAAVKTKKVFIKIAGVTSLIIFSPIYLAGLILAFVIAL